VSLRIGDRDRRCVTSDETAIPVVDPATAKDRGSTGTGDERLLLIRVRPLRMRKQLAQRDALLAAKDDLGVEIGRIDLPDELSAATAGRQNAQASVVISPNRNDAADSVLPCGDHGRDCSVLGAEPGA